MRPLFRHRLAVPLLASLALLAPALAAVPAAADPVDDAINTVTKTVKLKGLLKHADRLQAIADANGDNRASGLPGYDASAEYVAGKLRGAGYDVTVQPFDFPFFEEFGSTFQQTAPTPTDYVDGQDYDLMDYSGSGDVTASVVNVDLSLTPPRASTSGCEASDFLNPDGTSKVTGAIALVQRGTCGFGVKVANAEAAGAVGAVVMNQGNGDPVANADRYELFFGTLGGPVGIPAVSVSYFQGEEFATTAGLQLRIQADTISTIRSTSNVIAQTKRGRTDNVVMAGAHLDSEPDTAGINDNGSGSIALLEVAIKMADIRTPNAVRYAWWGAEESNLVGSTFYVNSLTTAQRDDIALYLNFDMVASPNYTFGVYDGDDSAGEGSAPVRPARPRSRTCSRSSSPTVTRPPRPRTSRAGRDYGPFIAVGIPAGGLFTGAEAIKSAADVALWGGLAGEQMDICYHDPCDSLTPEQDDAPPGLHDALVASGYTLYGNLNTYAFDVNADAIGTAVATFAFDTSTVNGDGGMADAKVVRIGASPPTGTLRGSRWQKSAAPGQPGRQTPWHSPTQRPTVDLCRSRSRRSTAGATGSRSSVSTARRWCRGSPRGTTTDAARCRALRRGGALRIELGGGVSWLPEAADLHPRTEHDTCQQANRAADRHGRRRHGRSEQLVVVTVAAWERTVGGPGTGTCRSGSTSTPTSSGRPCSG